MNHDQQLKIQSYVDGELSDSEARKVAEWISRDAEARGLCTELQCTRAALFGNELEVKVPESREFYWGKIARQIEQEEREMARPLVATPSPVFAWLQRLLVPAAGVAIVAALAVVAVNDKTTQSPPVNDFGEIEAHEMNAFTFRSQSERMTVVWVYNRNTSDVANDGANINPYE